MIFLSFAIVLFLPIFVFSWDNTFGLDKTASSTGFDVTGDQGDINSMASRIIRIGFGTVAFVFFGLTLYAGLRWLTARGKEELIERAKATMEQAIIGLVIVALSYAITNFVMQRLSSQEEIEGPSPKLPYEKCCIFDFDSDSDPKPYCKRITTEDGDFDCEFDGGTPQDDSCDTIVECGQGIEDPGNPFGDGNTGA